MNKVLMIAGIILGVALVAVGAVFLGMWLFTAPSYETVTKIAYSTDGGNSYREGTQEISVGATYYMSIEMQAVASKDRNAEDVTVQVKIPQTKIVDCYLDDYPGTKITGQEDALNGIITYEFKVPSSTVPSKFRVIFECIASQAGKHTIEIVYDDKVDPAWDRTETIKYISTAQEAA